MAVSTLALAAAGLMSTPTTVFADTDGQDRREDRRDDRQHAREGARDFKQND